MTNALGTSAAAIRGILANPSKTYSKNLREDVLVTAELTLVGTPHMEHSRNKRLWTLLSFRMSKEPHDGQAPNGLNSVLAHRGGGGIQPRNSPVPRRGHWMAHPPSKGKRGSNYRSVKTQAGSANEQCSDGAVGTVIGAFVPLSPVVGFLIVISAVGRARRCCVSRLRRAVFAAWPTGFDLRWQLRSQRPRQQHPRKPLTNLNLSVK